MIATPAIYLTWSIFTVLLGIFLIQHLWKFDKLRCLKWNHGPHSGAFKRFMTYTYMITLPCLAVFAFGFTVIKYKVGYTMTAEFGIIPTPFELWPQSYKRATFPLLLSFAIANAFEMVTHLEELCFWLFLVNAGQVQRDWFRSSYFKIWAIGSSVAIIYMPLVTILTRSDPLKCEASMFFASSIGGLLLTIAFTPILWTFPKFLNVLKREGVDMGTIVRLTTFYEMNRIRVIFRFLMSIPLLILGLDGIRPHSSHWHVIENAFWTEFLALIAGLGCTVSSAITLVIFFPRDIRAEIEAKEASQQARLRRGSRSECHNTDQNSSSSLSSQSPHLKEAASMSDYPRQGASATPTLSVDVRSSTTLPQDNDIDETKTVVTFAPNRRSSTGGTVEGHVAVISLAEQGLLRNARHPVAHNFTSPIDVIHDQGLPFSQMHLNRGASQFRP